MNGPGKPEPSPGPIYVEPGPLSTTVPFRSQFRALLKDAQLRNARPGRQTRLDLFSFNLQGHFGHLRRFPGQFCYELLVTIMAHEVKESRTRWRPTSADHASILSLRWPPGIPTLPRYLRGMPRILAPLSGGRVRFPQLGVDRNHAYLEYSKYRWTSPSSTVSPRWQSEATSLVIRRNKSGAHYVLEDTRWPQRLGIARGTS